MKYAVGQMGPTIFGGAITSCLAGVFLILCQADSLNKFGALLLVVIIVSMITSIFYLPALLCAFGPNGSQGDVYKFAKRMKKTFGRK